VKDQHSLSEAARRGVGGRAEKLLDDSDAIKVSEKEVIRKCYAQ
jgi:hypothetical protein